MQIKKKTKYLLTTSEDKHVIVAEVPHNYKHNDKEFCVSRDMVKANVESDVLTDMTGQLDWEGRIWILTEDIS